MVVLPLAELTTRLLSCSASRLLPEVLTLPRLPDTLPWTVKSWYVWPAAARKLLSLLTIRSPPS